VKERSPSHEVHRATSPTSIRCAVLTVSDTRTEDTDTGGRAIVDLLEGHGHQIVARGWVTDDAHKVRERLEELLTRDGVQVVITTGGTGLSSRDGTFEIASSLIDKPLPGFGELFRMLSFKEIGAAAMMSRACAGRARGRVLACLPGSEHGVRLAMTKLLLPELGHLVREVTR
jgi:molybdenum cofactor biosynthesis protein B